MLKLVMKSHEVEDATTHGKFNIYNFYIELENGYRVQVKPAFKEDFGKLRLLASRVED